MGVRQGCLLSPLLFTLFLNDLHESLEGGPRIGEREIRLLMYADDIVLLADNTETLQRMINRLEEYCKKWNLFVNLGKSKIMVYRKDGILSDKKKWYYQEDRIEVVRSYKYLGVELTQNLSFRSHLSARLDLAKKSINTVWGQFISKKDIKPSHKYQVFDAVQRSMVCYAAQVWGFTQYEEVERLQRYFIKRMIGLPENTPNYMLHLETGLSKMYLYTLKLHLQYIIKALSMPENRLPNFLAKAAIKENVLWVTELQKVMDNTGVTFNINEFSVLQWRKYCNQTLNKLCEIHWDEAVSLARSSQFHDEYPNLKYNSVPNYFRDSNPLEKVRLVFKVRGGLLDLNARPWKKDTLGNCSMCNMEVSENSYHFVAICPILTDYRVLLLGKPKLTHPEFIEILNGKDNYDNLYVYLINALKYRKFLIEQFNC